MVATALFTLKHIHFHANTEPRGGTCCGAAGFQ